MDNVTKILDMTMCLLWILTYTLVFIGTVKYQYPLISPITQAIIAPFEITVCVLMLFAFNYSSVAYLYWAIIEIAIYVAVKKTGVVSKKQYAFLAGLTLIVQISMVYVVIIKKEILLFSHVNTVIGVFFWLLYILRKEYPMKPMTLAIFVVKFAADVVNVVVYFGNDFWLIDFLNIQLPILDFVFIIVYIARTNRKIKGTVNSTKGGTTCATIQ